MSFFYRPAAAASSENVPTFPSGDLTIADSAESTSFNMVNSGTSPASVEFEFKLGDGSSASAFLVGVSPDDGTPASPSYVVDPDSDSGSPRSISVKRGSSRITADATVVTAFYTSNSGDVASFNVSLDKPNLAVFARSIATPTHEFLFDGNFNNTGSSGGTATGTGMTAVASTATTGFVGYSEQYQSNDRISNSSADVGKLRASTDRTWIYAWSNTNAVASGYVSIGSASSSNNGPGWLRSDGSEFYFSYPSTSLDTSGSHTGGGSSEALTTDLGELCLLAVSYDLSATTLTYRWKQTSHASGHSFTTTSKSAESATTSTGLWYFSGYASSAAHDMKWLHQSVFDATITAAQFDDLYATLS